MKSYLKKLHHTFLVSFLFLFVNYGFTQTIDQSQLNYNAGTSARTLPGYSHFQSFTAGLSGTLVEIEMGVFNPINGSGTLIIYAGPDTTGSILQNSTVSISCSSGNCMAAFPCSVNITAGQVYSFRFIPGNGIPDPYGLQMENPGTYPGGEFAIIDPSGIYFDGFDQVFVTHVNTTVGLLSTQNLESPFKVYPISNSLLRLSLDEKWFGADLIICNTAGQLIQQINSIHAANLEISNHTFENGIGIFNLSKDGKTIASQSVLIRK